MSDLYAVLPDFVFKDSNGVDQNTLSDAVEDLTPLKTTDLLTLPLHTLCQRGRKPAPVIRELVTQIVASLQADSGINTEARDRDPFRSPSFITTFDSTIDRFLSGGFPTGYLTEIVGESGCGKTQFLLTLLLTTQLPLRLGGIGRPAIYISTEAPLSVVRLNQIAAHINSTTTTTEPAVNLDQVFSYHLSDLEAQTHIIRYQLPQLVKERNVGLIVIDSIAANYRADLEDTLQVNVGTKPKISRGRSLAVRKTHLLRLATQLRELAVRHDLAVVVANQVADRFDKDDPRDTDTDRSTPSQSQTQTQTQTQSQTPNPMALPHRTNKPLTLDHQQRWITGWGDDDPELQQPSLGTMKTPALGQIWSNQLSARVVLKKSKFDVSTPGHSDSIYPTVRRKMRLVFAPWVHEDKELDLSAGVQYRIWAGGIKAEMQNGE